MVWSQLAELRTPPIATTDFLYLRFIGDRVMEMKKWASKVKRILKEEGSGGRKSINLVIVSANNHYAGFGLGTANIFRKMAGLPEAAWNKEEDDKSYLHSSSNNIQQHHNSNQSTLSDFMT
jgi:hypothetical protein